MSRFVTVFIFALVSSMFLASSVSGDECSTLTNCGDCLGDANCGWCVPTQTCHLGDPGGPTDGTVCLIDWLGNDPASPPNPGLCPVCSVYTTCFDCNTSPNCAWCSSPTSQCVDVTANPTCQAAHTCPCSEYTQCSDCTSDTTCVFCEQSMTCEDLSDNGNCGGSAPVTTCDCDHFATNCTVCNSQEPCGWCDSSQTCESKENTQCFLAHTCPPPPCPSHSGFSAGSFVGGMFLMLGIIILGAGGYFLFTHYIQKKVSYESVN